MRRWGAWCAVAVLVLGVACGGGGAGSRREAGQTGAPAAQAPGPSLERFPVPGGSGPHDVAPAPDGTVWYTAQAKGVLGRLDPASGRTTEVPLGHDTQGRERQHRCDEANRGWPQTTTLHSACVGRQGPRTLPAKRKIALSPPQNPPFLPYSG